MATRNNACCIQIDHINNRHQSVDAVHLSLLSKYNMAPYTFYCQTLLNVSANARHKIAYERLSRGSAVPGITFSFSLAYHVMRVVFLCCLLWEIVHLLFNVYISQIPIVQGRTISQKSAAQNETLLLGLKSDHKELTQVCASTSGCALTKGCVDHGLRRTYVHLL